MKLFTKKIYDSAQKQYPLGSDMSQMIVAKFFDPRGSWTWYLMNQDPTDQDYLWGIVDGFEVEMGSFSLRELDSIGYIERDLYFTPITAQECWDRLNNGEHV